MTYREDAYADVGELNTFIEILTPPKSDDFRGTPVQNVVGECWAAWETLRGQRAQTLQQQYGSVTGRVVIRYRANVRPGMYIRKKGGPSQAAIAAVVPVDSGERWMELMVNEVTSGR